MINKKIKIAIIGGSSFIGQNLIQYLLKKKYIKVVATYTNSLQVTKKFNTVVWKKLDINKDKKNYFKFLKSPDILINCDWPDIPNYNSKNHY